MEEITALLEQPPLMSDPDLLQWGVRAVAEGDVRLLFACQIAR